MKYVKGKKVFSKETIAELRSTITTLKEQKEEVKNEKQEKISQKVRNVKAQIKEREQLLEALTDFKRKQDRKKEYQAELKEKQEKEDRLIQNIST
ncbi:MAG: hypothetical protein GWO20_17435, partial [Candidatus Korarchaeota archaeon]|nr:hypothetical protein [Candidatus Korarchaeota archaeon]NIU85131.1 hypothetical protein [Candidatus Thorarchaeota archaeon]NIW15179.1 hypothetical protein [Candidatus Thorarchaeota archaeon]NIW53167.1 hypothetical protein [Candidatus Korarchaeota archaeon]